MQGSLPQNVQGSHPPSQPGSSHPAQPGVEIGEGDGDQDHFWIFSQRKNTDHTLVYNQCAAPSDHNTAISFEISKNLLILHFTFYILHFTFYILHFTF